MILSAVASRFVTNASSSTNESGIEQQVEPLARRQLARLVLFRDAGLAAALPRCRAHLLKAIESLRVRRHRCTAPFGLSLRKDIAIIDTPRPVEAHPDIHKFGEQLANRVDNRVPGWQVPGVHGGTRSPPRRPRAVHRDSEVMPR